VRNPADIGETVDRVLKQNTGTAGVAGHRVQGEAVES
jgi:hypothetical protein